MCLVTLSTPLLVLHAVFFAVSRTLTIVHPYSAVIDGIGKPFYRGGVPRFLGGGLGGFGCCKAIENIRRYTPVKGIVVRQVGADAETITHVVRNTPLHARAISSILGHLFDSSNQWRFRTQA